ncbi:uncharacterized protein LOC131629512 [Vicia villosa]|uniref:uncharacterized protein LOC131629512 n=1 Tax=Vicia villosa TaxID=3911 RepID=UPI00273B47D1|nr:uncharacterized protein LOC131629512 [Vicia villosa]
MYCGLSPEDLEALLDGQDENDILDIQPLSVDTSAPPNADQNFSAPPNADQNFSAPPNANQDADMNHDASPIKRTKPRMFFGPRPKISKSTKALSPNAKKPKSPLPNMSKSPIQHESPKQTMSDPVKAMISKKKRETHGGTPIRKSDRLMTLKTRAITGPGKDFDDPLVIQDEDFEVDNGVGKTSWKNIKKNMTQ